MKECERESERQNCMVPCLVHRLHHPKPVPGVITDMNAKGCAVRTTDDGIEEHGLELVGERVLIEFSIGPVRLTKGFGAVASEIRQVRCDTPTPYECSLGVRFLRIDPLVARDLEMVLAEMDG